MTIKERAKLYADKCTPQWYGEEARNTARQYHESVYTEIATEQKTIDIGKMCDAIDTLSDELPFSARNLIKNIIREALRGRKKQISKQR